VASVPRDWQLQSVLVAALLLREDLLEARAQVLEFKRVAEVRLQDTRPHLGVLDLARRRTIQVVLEALRTERSTSLLRCLTKLLSFLFCL